MVFGCVIVKHPSAGFFLSAKALVRFSLLVETSRRRLNTLLYGERGQENVLLSIEVNELSRANRTARRMDQTVVCCGTEHSPCVVSSLLGSSARLQVTLSLELRQAQLTNESTMQRRERDILLRLGNDAQDALQQQKAQLVHEQPHLVHEREAQDRPGNINAIFERRRICTRQHQGEAPDSQRKVA